MTRQRAARVTRGPELEAPVLLPVTQPAATVGCCEYGGACSCDDDCDEPSAAELRWSDMEADRDAVRSAVRRGL